MNLLPSDFTNQPWGSVAQKSEAEAVARNIMVILKRTGNTWRKMTYEEYKEERQKDGDYSGGELMYFDAVVGYTASADTAALFSKEWNKQPA